MHMQSSVKSNPSRFFAFFKGAYSLISLLLVGGICFCMELKRLSIPSAEIAEVLATVLCVTVFARTNRRPFEWVNKNMLYYAIPSVAVFLLCMLLDTSFVKRIFDSTAQRPGTGESLAFFMGMMFFTYCLCTIALSAVYPAGKEVFMPSTSTPQTAPQQSAERFYL